MYLIPKAEWQPIIIDLTFNDNVLVEYPLCFIEPLDAQPTACNLFYKFFPALLAIYWLTALISVAISCLTGEKLRRKPDTLDPSHIRRRNRLLGLRFMIFPGSLMELMFPFLNSETLHLN